MNMVDCPYGAEECPKLTDLDKFDEEITALRESVASLNSTVHMMTYVMGLLMTVSTGIGVFI